jgi:ABC-type methionine transport system ATPase subunit
MAGESQRYWLTFPVEQVKRPLIWQMSKHFDLIFNIRNASVTERVGIIALELTGERKTIELAVKWFRRQGVKINPIELDVIES